MPKAMGRRVDNCEMGCGSSLDHLYFSHEISLAHLTLAGDSRLALRLAPAVDLEAFATAAGSRSSRSAKSGVVRSYICPVQVPTLPSTPVTLLCLSTCPKVTLQQGRTRPLFRPSCCPAAPPRSVAPSKSGRLGELQGCLVVSFALCHTGRGSVYCYITPYSLNLMPALLRTLT
jgi:hypothetical protein